MMATAWTDGDGSGGGSNHGSLVLWVSIPSSRVSMGDGVPLHWCLSLACLCNSGSGGEGNGALALLASLVLWRNNGVGGRAGDGV